MTKHILNKFLFLIFFIIFFIKPSFSSIVLATPDKMDIPGKKSFTFNTEFIRSFKIKKITIIEYITDPLIMYTSLWACLGITLPLWERSLGLAQGDQSYWEQDTLRGFDKLRTEDTFFNRLKMEPFASGRVDPFTKVLNGKIVLRGDVYAKNIIEPVFFTYLALYMRAKNYHPAIMITEIILLSLLYEFTIRPFFMNSSFEQLFKNPGISLVVAILFDELSTYLLTTPHIGLHVLAYILNPFNSLPNSRIHSMLFFDPYRKTASIEAIIKL